MSPASSKPTPYTIGYVELAYALQNHFTFAKIQNAAGKYVTPSLASVAADAAQKPNITSVDFSIVNQPGATQLPHLGLQLGARLPASEERYDGHDAGARARLADPRRAIASPPCARLRPAARQHPAAGPDDTAAGDGPDGKTQLLTTS